MSTESPSSTVIRGPTDPPIIDQYSNQWSISQGRQVVIDGFTDPSTANVRELWYIGRIIWQYTDARLWWSKSGPAAPWSPPAGTPYAPFTTPTSDPRIDVLQTSVDQLSATLTSDMRALAEAIHRVRADVDQIPNAIPSDPRIDALLSGQATLGDTVSQAQTDLALRLDLLTGVVQANQADLLTRLDLITTQHAAEQAKVDALAAQMERAIVMLLDLLSGKPPAGKVSISADLAHATHTRSQAVPGQTGP